jgi:hypothetical protein
MSWYRLMTKFTFDSVKKERPLARADYQAFNMQDYTFPALDLFSTDEVFHGEFAHWFVSGLNWTSGFIRRFGL